MNPTALLALLLSFQAAGQAKPPSAPPQAQIPPVATDLPVKFTAPPPGPNTPVAKIDGQPIYGKDVEALLWELLGPQEVEDFVTLVMVRRAGEAQGIKATQPEVEQRLKEDLVLYEKQTRQGQNARPPGTSVEDFLKAKGYPMSRLYLNTEVEVILDKMAEKTFKPENWVTVSLMYFRSDADTTVANDAVLKKAQDAVTKLKAGTKWETIIATSAVQGDFLKANGLLGWHEYSEFPPEVTAQLKGLLPGQISAPVKALNPNPSVPAGPAVYQIFRVEKLGTKAVGADLTELKAHYVSGAHTKLLKTIRDAAKIERFPTKEPTGATTTPVK